MKAMSKKSFITYVSVTTLLLIVYLTCTFFYLERNEKKEIIALINKVFRIDISDSNFTYQSSLGTIIEGGELLIQIATDKRTAEAWMDACSDETYWDEDSSYFQEVLEFTGFTKEKINGRICTEYTDGTAREIPLRANPFKHARGTDIPKHIVYFHKNAADSYTVYFKYVEVSPGLYILAKLLFFFLLILIAISVIWQLMHPKKLFKMLTAKQSFHIDFSNLSFKKRISKHTIITCIIAATVFIIIMVSVLTYFTSQERRRQETIEIIQLCFGVNISDESFTYEYSLRPLTAGGELLVQVTLDVEKAKLWTDWFAKTYTNDDTHDFLGRVMRFTGRDRTTLDGKTFVTFESGTIRAVPFNSSPFVYMFHTDNHLIYVEQDTSESVKVYFDYLESDDKGLFIIETRLIILLVGLLLVIIVIRKNCTLKQS